MSSSDTGNDFSKGSVVKNILYLAVPMTLAQLINVLYNIVDRIYIGRMADGASAALTGIGVCLPITTMILAFSNLIGSGGAPFFSIERGRKNDEGAQTILSNSLTLILIISSVIMLVGYVFKTPLLRLLGASDETLPYASSYLGIYLAGTLFVMLSLGLNSFINAQGFGKTGLLTVAIGAGLNILLDPIFIFVLNMGVKGAAIATVISQFASAVWTFCFLISKKADIKIDFAKMKLVGVYVKRILSLGLSGFIMGVTNSAVSMVCNATLSVWGSDTYIAVMTIINSVREIIHLPVMGINGASQPVVSYNYGAGEYERVKSGIRWSSGMMIAYTSVMWIVVIVFAKYFIGMFTSDPIIMEIGVPSLHIYFFGFVFMSFQFSGQTAFVALGKSKQAIIFSLLRKAFIVIPLTIILPYYFGVDGVFIAEPVSNIIGGSASFLTMILTVYRKL